MKLKKNVVAREIMGETVLVPLGEANDFNGMIILNETAGEVWKRLPDAASTDDIVRELLEIYDVSEKTLKCDVDEFLNELKKFEII